MQVQSTTPTDPNVSARTGQADINEVNKTAHTIKARLEALDNANKKAITQPVRCGRYPDAGIKTLLEEVSSIMQAGLARCGKRTLCWCWC